MVDAAEQPLLQTRPAQSLFPPLKHGTSISNIYEEVMKNLFQYEANFSFML